MFSNIKKIITQEQELKFYKRLGVLNFQKIVFKLEHLIHYKDHGHNINYHPKGNSIFELEKFKKYLYYNGSIHTKNIFILLSFIIIDIFLIHSNILLISSILLLIKDTYCVMLQRYNYIRINKTIEKMKVIEKKHRIQVKEELKKDEKLCNILKSINLDLLTKLENAIVNREGVSFDSKDIESLRNVEVVIDTPKIKKQVKEC